MGHGVLSWVELNELRFVLSHPFARNAKGWGTGF
jgi:hypothetical protein